MFSRWAQLLVITLLATCPVIAQQDGSSVGTQQVSGAARISRGSSGTLDHAALQSRDVYRRYADLSESELRKLAGL